MATEFKPSSKGCVPPRDSSPSAALQGYIIDATKAQARLLRGSDMPFKSERPYEYDLEAAGLCLLVDYEWDYDDGRAVVQITRVVLQGHDGSEYPLKAGAIRGRTWQEIESLIADEINDDNDCAAQALRDEP